MNNLSMYTNKELREMNKKDKIEAILHNQEMIQILEQRQKLENQAQEIRNTLLNKEGIENRQKLRRKYMDIIMLDDNELVKMYLENKLPIQ